MIFPPEARIQRLLIFVYEILREPVAVKPTEFTSADKLIPFVL